MKKILTALLLLTVVSSMFLSCKSDSDEESGIFANACFTSPVDTIYMEPNSASIRLCAFYGQGYAAHLGTVISWESDNINVASVSVYGKTVAGDSLFALADVKPGRNSGLAAITATFTLNGQSKKLTQWVRLFNPQDTIKPYVYTLPDGAIMERVGKGTIHFYMLPVKGSTYLMGPWNGIANTLSIGNSQQTVSDFYISQTEITDEVWQAVMTGSDEVKNATQKPRTGTSYVDLYYNFLPKLRHMTGRNYRIATEAEWEWAYRGGVKSKGFIYSGSNSISDVAWVNDNSNGFLKAVGRLHANELGIFDMEGNASEIVSDSLWTYTYSKTTGAKTDSTFWRIKRGLPCNAKSSYYYRSTIKNAAGDSYVGFRLVLPATSPIIQ